MVEYNGAFLPDWLRITGVKCQTLDDKVVDLGHQRITIAMFDSKLVANRSSKPCAILSARMDFISVYQSVTQCERDVGPVKEKIESGAPLFGCLYVIRISRAEFNIQIELGTPSLLPKQMCHKVGE